MFEKIKKLFKKDNAVKEIEKDITDEINSEEETAEKKNFEEILEEKTSEAKIEEKSEIEKKIEKSEIISETQKEPEKSEEKIKEEVSEVKIEVKEPEEEKEDEKPSEEIITPKEEKTPEKTEKKTGFFQKIVNGLKKTRDNFTEKIDDVIFSFKKIDEDMLEELEEILIMADIGMPTVMDLMDRLRNRIKEEKTQDPGDVKRLLKEETQKLMESSVESNKLTLEPLPAILLVVGVNGVGKTTTIGKLAHRFKDEGKSVLLAAGDTFRAAAIEQLTEWGKRSQIEVIAHEEASDPASVIFDAIGAAKARKTDVLICDTAGRLHNKANLMNELGKIFKVVEREYPEAKKEVLLVLDATTGQNALSQAKTFKEVCDVSGIALTKLDGTAKGGVVIALEREIGIPVKLVGVGEGIDDLQPFDNKAFVEGIFS